MEELLSGPLGTLPLAPLGKLPPGLTPEEGLSSVIERLVERVQRDASAAHARKLLTAAFILTGLRLDRSVVRGLFGGVRPMRESDTYQGILDEGRVEALQRTLLRLGRKRFGPPDKPMQATLKGITDVRRLERLTERLLDISSWDDLLSKK